MSLLQLTIDDLLRRFSSSDPTPGGGSASALSSAIGTSLLMMVAALPKTRSGSEEDRSALGRAAAELPEIRDRLATAIDEDTAAYDAVVAAYKLPTGSSGGRDRWRRITVGAFTYASTCTLNGHG